MTSRGEHLRFSAGDVVKNRYEILEEVGCGNFSKVYRCLDRSRSDPGERKRTPVAMKVLKKEYKKDAAFERRMLRVLQDRDRTGTARVAKMVDYFEWQECPVFIMPIHGPSIRARRLGIDRGVVTRPLLIAFAYDILETLAYVHFTCRMVHTDLKPENILIADAGVTSSKSMGDSWVICDFGSASLWRMEKLDSDLISTRPYRAPEVVLGNKWYYPADMWSVGCILYEVAVGHRLFEVRDDNTHLQMMDRRIGRIPDSLRRHSKYGARFFSAKGDFVIVPDVIRNARCRLTPVADVFRKDPEMLRLLQGFLIYDPAKRLTAAEALANPLFDDIRQERKLLLQQQQKLHHHQQQQRTPPRPQKMMLPTPTVHDDSHISSSSGAMENSSCVPSTDHSGLWPCQAPASSSSQLSQVQQQQQQRGASKGPRRRAPPSVSLSLAPSTDHSGIHSTAEDDGTPATAAARHTDPNAKPKRTSSSSGGGGVPAAPAPQGAPAAMVRSGNASDRTPSKAPAEANGAGNGAAADRRRPVNPRTYKTAKPSAGTAAPAAVRSVSGARPAARSLGASLTSQSLATDAATTPRGSRRGSRTTSPRTPRKPSSGATKRTSSAPATPRTPGGGGGGGRSANSSSSTAAAAARTRQRTASAGAMKVVVKESPPPAQRLKPKTSGAPATAAAAGRTTAARTASSSSGRIVVTRRTPSRGTGRRSPTTSSLGAGDSRRGRSGRPGSRTASAHSPAAAVERTGSRGPPPVRPGDPPLFIATNSRDFRRPSAASSAALDQRSSRTQSPTASRASGSGSGPHGGRVHSVAARPASSRDRAVLEASLSSVNSAVMRTSLAVTPTVSADRRRGDGKLSASGSYRGSGIPPARRPSNTVSGWEDGSSSQLLPQQQQQQRGGVREFRQATEIDSTDRVIADALTNAPVMAAAAAASQAAGGSGIGSAPESPKTPQAARPVAARPMKPRMALRIPVGGGNAAMDRRPPPAVLPADKATSGGGAHDDPLHAPGSHSNSGSFRPAAPAPSIESLSCSSSPNTRRHGGGAGSPHHLRTLSSTAGDSLAASWAAGSPRPDDYTSPVRLREADSKDLSSMGSPRSWTAANEHSPISRVPSQSDGSPVAAPAPAPAAGRGGGKSPTGVATTTTVTRTMHKRPAKGSRSRSRSKKRSPSKQAAPAPVIERRCSGAIPPAKAGCAPATNTSSDSTMGSSAAGGCSGSVRASADGPIRAADDEPGPVPPSVAAANPSGVLRERSGSIAYKSPPPQAASRAAAAASGGRSNAYAAHRNRYMGPSTLTKKATTRPPAAGANAVYAVAKSTSPSAERDDSGVAAAAAVGPNRRRNVVGGASAAAGQQQQQQRNNSASASQVLDGAAAGSGSLSFAMLSRDHNGKLSAAPLSP